MFNVFNSVEIVADLPEVDCILVPVGGGGMIAGIAAYIKHHNPHIQVRAASLVWSTRVHTAIHCLFVV